MRSRPDIGAEHGFRKALSARVLGVWALAAGPLLVALWFTFVEPRPYYYMTADVEADYIYNARLILAGQGVAGTYHPGTPLYYLVALLMWAVGDDLGQTQAVLDVGYLCVGALTSGALALVARDALRAFSPGVVALFVAAALAWPSNVRYLNFVAPDALVVAVGLPLVWLFWKNLMEYRSRRLCGTGALCGLALALKLTFLPLVACVGAALAVRQAAGWTRRWRGLALFGGSASGVFVLSTLPVLDHMPGVLVHTLLRAQVVSVVRSPGGRGEEVQTSLRLFEQLVRAADPFVLLALGLVVLVVWGVLRPRRDGRPTLGPSTPAVGVFVVLGLAALVYTALVSIELRTATLSRNAAPAALVAPVLVLVAAKLWRYSARRGHRGRGGWIDAALVLVALGVVGTVVWTEAAARRSFLRAAPAHAAAVQTGLRAALTIPEAARLAFWDGSPGRAMGPASFHFWGNYRYGEEQFDELLLDAFPDYSYVRLRAVGRERSLRPAPASALQPSPLKRLLRHFYDRRGSARRVPHDYLFAGRSGAGVHAVAIPVGELEVEWAGVHTDLEQRLGRSLGPVRVRHAEIGGMQWWLAERTPPAVPSP